MTKIQKQQIDAGLRVVAAVADAIRELGEVPEGHLYTMLMSKFSLQDFNAIIRLLAEKKLIRVEEHLITWIGWEVLGQEDRFNLAERAAKIQEVK